MKLVNKFLESYLHCFSLEQQAKWVQLLPLKEWWYITTYHGDTNMTPFEAVYEHNPPINDFILDRLLQGSGGGKNPDNSCIHSL